MRSTRTALPVIALVWIGCTYGMAQYGAPLLPRGLAAQLSLQSFLILVLVLASAIGLALSAALSPRGVRDLATHRPHASHAVVALIVAPLVVVGSLYLGFELALDTLIAEIRAGGRRAAQANTGEFGRAIVATHVATTVLWAVVVTPVAEELMFRGALWGAVTSWTRPWADRVRSLPPELVQDRGRGGVGRFLLTGGIATLVSAAVFTWLHADQEGGAGIVRAVQAGCLGVALGAMRHGTGSIWPGVLLHAEFNLFAIAKSRKWFVSEMWPPPLPIPLLYWQLAGGCGVLFGLWLLHRWSRLRHVTARATLFVNRPRETVFDYVIDPASIPAGFEGHGPIPAAERAELDGAMRVGARRRVHNAGGSTVEELIVAVERPEHHAYEIVSGLAPPLSFLVVGGRGDWQLDQEGDGTLVTWTFRWNLTTGLAWPLAVAVRRPFARAMRGCLENHRSHLESGVLP